MAKLIIFSFLLLATLHQIHAGVHLLSKKQNNAIDRINQAEETANSIRSDHESKNDLLKALQDISSLLKSNGPMVVNRTHIFEAVDEIAKAINSLLNCAVGFESRGIDILKESATLVNFMQQFITRIIDNVTFTAKLLHVAQLALLLEEHVSWTDADASENPRTLWFKAAHRIFHLIWENEIENDGNDLEICIVLGIMEMFNESYSINSYWSHDYSKIILNAIIYLVSHLHYIQEENITILSYRNPHEAAVPVLEAVVDLIRLVDTVPRSDKIVLIQYPINLIDIIKLMVTLMPYQDNRKDATFKVNRVLETIKTILDTIKLARRAGPDRTVLSCSIKMVSGIRDHMRGVINIHKVLQGPAEAALYLLNAVTEVLDIEKKTERKVDIDEVRTARFFGMVVARFIYSLCDVFDEDGLSYIRVSLRNLMTKFDYSIKYPHTRALDIDIANIRVGIIQIISDISEALRHYIEYYHAHL